MLVLIKCFALRRDPVGVPFVKKIRGTYVLGDTPFETVIEEDIQRLQSHGVDKGHGTQPPEGSLNSGAGAMAVPNHDNSGVALPHQASTYGSAFNDAYFADLPNGHGAHCYVGRGMYMLQIQQWLRAGFKREQLLIVCTERLHENPKREIDRVFHFLGLPPCDNIDTTPVNTAKQRGRTFGPMQEVRRGATHQPSPLCGPPALFWCL